LADAAIQQLFDVFEGVDATASHYGLVAGDYLYNGSIGCRRLFGVF
jgi:hypothetical protein